MPNKKKQRKLSCPKQSSGIVDKPMNIYKVENHSCSHLHRKTDKPSIEHLVNQIYGNAPTEFKKVFSS
tara:strand:- start:38 stop:241 length:204 start_codon:yes stop_codon:yes gene_type:complete